MQNHKFTFDEYQSLVNKFFVEGETFIDVSIPCDLHGEVRRCVLSNGKLIGFYITKEHFTSIEIHIDNLIPSCRERYIWLGNGQDAFVDILNYKGEASDTAFQLVKDALKSGKYIKKCSHRAMVNGKEEWISTEYNGLGDE